MNKVFEIIVRASIQVIAGAVVSKGIVISDSHIEQIAGAATIIVTVIWSIWAKNKAANEKLKANPAAGTGD
jgi:hypothetical protein